jgi:AcrR family transcriptional regulator
MATQQERRAATRSRLLDAAAELFARHGIEAASVDAIAEAAERTSGALYGQFGSKEGLLTALLDRWLEQMSTVTAAEVLAAPTKDAQLAAIWRNFAEPTPWVQLEHELWLYATRHADTNADAADRVAARYRDAAARVDEFAGRADVGRLVIALMIGLEMQHRVDPDAVDDALAVAGLRALIGGRKR